MLPTSFGLLLAALVLNIVRAECPGERPTKHIFCYVSEISEQFDPCLCTHLVLQAPLEKLSQKSGLMREARRLRDVNPSLRLVSRVQETAEVALKRRGGYAQTVVQALAKSGVDDVEVALGWGRQVAGKLQLVDFIKSLSKELAKLEPKTSSKTVDILIDDAEEPDRNNVVRKTREAEKTTTTETTTMKDKESATVKDKESTTESEDEDSTQDSNRQIILHLASEPQLLAKNFDLKRLSKYVSLFTLASDNLTDASEQGLAYHPSRLMGIEDILNADSLIDLVTGLGAPREKLILTLPATALKFTLLDKDQNMPQSKVTGEPSTISRAELCTLMSAGGWTVERDEDLTAPYAYHDTTWVAFDDPTSVSIKGKYVLLRELAGAAVVGADAEDWLNKCDNSSGPALLSALKHTFTEVARQPRAAQLLSLQDQLHEAGHFSYSGDVQLSPYRIVRVVDREGSIHVVRKEAKTEFECSRQGYFRHPSGCNRFYRCVKFNQLTPDFTVFEYDCPAGLAFDESVEVCVWPGSLADGGACQGSSEIAPVPRSRYVCPEVAGYYADPENCRWFFACIDHQGDGSGLTAYEFRCPFGLVFDEQALVCNWPWLVPGCGGAGVYRARFTVGDFYEGRHRPSYASLSDVHVSGGRIENVAGGVVLDSSVPGLGSGAYLGSYAAGSNVLGSGAYSAGGAYQGSRQGSLGTGYGTTSTVGDAYSSGISDGSYVTGGLGSRGSGSYTAGSGGAVYGAGAGYAAGSGSGSLSAGSSGAGSAGHQGAGYGSRAEYHSGAGYGSGSSGAGYAAGGGSGAYIAGISLQNSAGYKSGYASGIDSGSYAAGTSESAGGEAYSADLGSAGYKSGAGHVAEHTGTDYSVTGSYKAGSTGSVGGVAYNAKPGNVYTYGSHGVAGGYSGESLYTNAYGGAGTYGSYDNSGAYIHDNSGDYIHDNSGAYEGDLLGFYTGKQSSGGQYADGHLSGGAYIHGNYDNGAYRGSSSSGGQYEGNYLGAVAYSGAYDTGSYQGSQSSSGSYKDGGAYLGYSGSGGYNGKYSGGAYTGSSDSGAYSGKYSGGAYTGSADAGAYSGKYNGGAYTGSADAGAYSGKYNGGAYTGSADAGAYSGKYSGGAYTGSADAGAYSGKYNGGAYTGSADAGAYLSAVAGSHLEGYNSVNVVEHHPTVEVTGGDHFSGGYVSGLATPTPVPLTPVVSYSTTPRPLTYYPVPSSPVTPLPSKPLIAYSTVKPPIAVQSYKQPSYVQTVPSYSYPTPTIGVVKSPIVPLSPVTYTYKQPVTVNTYQQQSYVKAVTPSNHYDKVTVEHSYQKPQKPAYLSPLPSHSYDYKPQVVTHGQAYQVQDTYHKPAVVSTIQYSTVSPIAHPVSTVTYDTPAAPVPVLNTVYRPTVLKTPVVPYNPVQYTTSSPAYIQYSTPAPQVSYQEIVKPVTYTTPAPPVNYEYLPPKPLKPITYVNSAPVSVDYNGPTVYKNAAVAFNPIQYSTLRPVVHTTPAPAVSYDYSSPAILHPVSQVKLAAPVVRPIRPIVTNAPVVPYNPIQYTTLAPQRYEFGFSTPAPPSYVKPVAPEVTYQYSTPAPPPVRPVVYSAPAAYVKPVVPEVTYQYSTPAPPPVRPVVYSAPATYVKPVAPEVTYQYSTPAPPPVRPVVYSAPAAYVKPVAPEVTYQYSTPAPPPVRPVVYSAPATYVKPVAPEVTYQYSTPAPPPVRPVVYSAPAAYVKPVAPEVTYQYSTPAPPPARPVVYSAPATYVKPVAPEVTYQYLTPAPPPARPVVYSAPATYVKPEVTYQYSTPAPPAARPVVYSTTASPVLSHVVPVVLNNPVPPLNPIQYTTSAPVYHQYSTPSPITYSSPSPAVNYQYIPPAPVEPVRPLKPVVYQAPEIQVNREYLPPAPVRPITYSAPAPHPGINFKYSAPVVPAVYKTPVIPLNPIQYTTPAPVYHEYSTAAPIPVKPVTYTTPAPTFTSVRPITLSSPAPFSYQQVPSFINPPVVPLNPVQYSTPAPDILRYSTPVRPVTYTTSVPQVTYVKPVPTVLKTPVIPLNPVQYTTPTPIVNSYESGVTYQKPNIQQYHQEVYYQRPSVVRTQGYDYPKPSVKFVETPQVVSTTPAPTVTYTHETHESEVPLYKTIYNYVKAPMVSAYEKVLNTISYSTTPSPAPLPVQTVTQSPVTYAPINVGSSYRRPALVETSAIPVTPVHVVPEYQEVLNVVKTSTTSSPLYVNHYSTVSGASPSVYKQKPIVVPEESYSYEENIEDTYDILKSDFGTRLDGSYEQGYVQNQQRLVVPEVVAYTPTPAVVPVLKARKPVKTYLPAYEQPSLAVAYEKPAVAVGYDAGSYNRGAVFSTTSAPTIISSTDATFGDQYHKETVFSGYSGQAGDSVTPCDHGVTSTTTGPVVEVTTGRVIVPVVTSRPQGGYYVRKQVRIRPVVTTENYPDVYSSTYTPSTVSTTTYRTTSAPKVVYSTTAHPEDVVDIEGEEEELLEGYNKQFGGMVGEGGYSASSTVASIEDGEAVVGVLHKGRITQDGRRTKSKVVVVSKLSDFNPLLVGKLGAECSCDGKSETLTVRRGKQRGSARLFTPSRDSTIPDQQLVDSYRTSTSTLAPIIITESITPVVEIRPIRKKVRFQSSTTTTTSPDVYLETSEQPFIVPSGGNDRVRADSALCKRAGLFRHPNKCNKFYSCDWDQWKKKFTLNEFKCPIHLAYDVNLGACNWPSKGPACAEDNLLV